MIDSDSWITYLTEIHTNMVAQHVITTLKEQSVAIAIISRRIDLGRYAVEVLSDGTAMTTIHKKSYPVEHVYRDRWVIQTGTEVIAEGGKDYDELDNDEEDDDEDDEDTQTVRKFSKRRYR